MCPATYKFKYKDFKCINGNEKSFYDFTYTNFNY